MLLAVEVLTVWVGVLNVRRSLLGDRRTRSRSGRTRLEHLRILDERLWNTVPRIVGRPVILILVREIMVGNRVGVPLLWALATGGWRLIVRLAGLLG